jgi:phenylpropionate dioxygenase-like ring-hydroxylating dioxygenase large terminal subunit
MERMFIKDSWYVAAWAKDLNRSLLTRTILDEPIVFYRKESGEPVALEDRCAHRHAPLHLGRLVGDNLQCGYHGLTFGCDGVCTFIPSQDKIPAKARIKSYPIVERNDWIWIWMGERAVADATRIPDFSRVGDPAFAATGATNIVNANFELINDNLMDLSHVGYVHGSTIGTTEMGGKAHMKTERTEKGVRVTRWVIDCPAPPTYLKTGVFSETDRIDRWQIIDFEPPCFITIHVGGAPTGTGAPEGKRVGGIGMWVMNAMTPATESETHYFWAVGRDFAPDNPAVTNALHAEVAKAFNEDKHILEEQQKVIHLFVDPENVDIVSDAGSIQARRILRQRLKDKAAAVA